MKGKNIFRPLLLTGCLAALLAQSHAQNLAQPTDLATLVTAAARYDSSQSMAPLRELEASVREALAKPSLRPEVETALWVLLAPEATLEAKRFACRQLGIIGSDRSLPALTPLLASDETASLACLALSTYPPGRADEVLRNALPSARGRAQVQIIDTLGDRRDRQTVPLLAALAREADTTTASAVVAALAKIGDASARQSLAELRASRGVELASAFWDADLRLAQQLVRSGDRKAAAQLCDALLASGTPVFIRRGVFDLRLQCERDGGEKLIRQTLAGSDAALKTVALAAVRRLPARTASANFGQLLPTLPPAGQIWLLDSLAARNDAAARAVIANSLSTASDPEVRTAAAQALGRIGNAEAVRPLTQALATARDESETRIYVAALAGLPGTAAVEQALLAELSQAPVPIRPALMTALAGRRSPAVYAALLAQSSEPNEGVCRAAYRALARATTAQNLPALFARFTAMPDPRRRAAVEPLLSQAVLNVERPQDRSAAVAAVLSQTTDLETRLALLRLLPVCGNDDALRLTQAAVADSDGRVRETGVECLADWPTTSAWEALAGIFRQGNGHPQRAVVLRGLTRLVNDENPSAEVLVARYETLLAGALGNAELKMILGAMGAARQVGVLRLAVPLLQVQGVRPEAEMAVQKIAEAVKAQDPAAVKAALDQLARPQ